MCLSLFKSQSEIISSMFLIVIVVTVGSLILAGSINPMLNFLNSLVQSKEDPLIYVKFIYANFVDSKKISIIIYNDNSQSITIYKPMIKIYSPSKYGACIINLNNIYLEPKKYIIKNITLPYSCKINSSDKPVQICFITKYQYCLDIN